MITKQVPAKGCPWVEGEFFSSWKEKKRGKGEGQQSPKVYCEECLRLLSPNSTSKKRLSAKTVSTVRATDDSSYPSICPEYTETRRKWLRHPRRAEISQCIQACIIPSSSGRPSRNFPHQTSVIFSTAPVTYVTCTETLTTTRHCIEHVIWVSFWTMFLSAFLIFSDISPSPSLPRCMCTTPQVEPAT